ncbi:Ubiquitin conjugation factor E4 A [Lamellibrachia satsuma]|nr:Ubiquitin conjugation factor E4 A [Lamellibrachia satsuma]
MWPPTSWSVFGQSVRTNNDVEGWHHGFNTKAKQQMPFYQLTSQLYEEAAQIELTLRLYMAQVKEKQVEQEKGDWERLSASERQEAENEFHHLSMLARFYNIMGSETIQCLELLTKEIKTIFCHMMIVDRMASMLNYFLLHLKILKVKDFTELDFKLQQLLSDISAIYVNLGDADAFCTAISRDERSYSQSLFELAEVFLNKIYVPVETIQNFNRVAAHIQTLSVQQQSEDDLMADAPEEFLDAIMGTLMRDPVTLPSSGQTVDRSTIARHILSDQTDPFNCQPLTLDMVIPATDLRLRMEQRLQEKKVSEAAAAALTTTDH